METTCYWKAVSGHFGRIPTGLSLMALLATNVPKHMPQAVLGPTFTDPGYLAAGKTEEFPS